MPPVGTVADVDPPVPAPREIGATPIPERLTVCGEPGALSVIVKDPASAALDAGAKVTEIWQLRPGQATAQSDLSGVCQQWTLRSDSSYATVRSSSTFCTCGIDFASFSTSRFSDFVRTLPVITRSPFVDVPVMVLPGRARE